MNQDDHSESSPISQSEEIGRATWMIEQLEIDAGQPSDWARVRRAVEEAVNTWTGDATDRWWRWVVEAGESLGLNSRPVDCTLDQLCEVAREGGRVIVRIPSTGDWVGIARMRGRKALVVHPWKERSQRWVSKRHLRGMVEADETTKLIRCVVVQPKLLGTLTDDPQVEYQSPFARAWSMLRPEWGDIRIVMIFALVSGLLALATPLAIEALVSTVTFGRLLQPIVVLSLLLFGFLSFQAAVRGLQTFVVEIIQRRLFARVAADVAYRLPRTQYEAVEGKFSRELVNRFFDVVTVQKVTAQLLLDGVTIAVNTLVGMAVLGFYHPWLLGFDVMLLAMITFVIFVMGRGAVATSIKESKLKYQVASWLEDLSGCPIAFRYEGAPQFALGRADRMIYEYLKARRKHFSILLRQILFALGLQAVASTVLLGLGGWLVISEELTLGQLVAAELIVTVIVGSFAKLGKHMESFYDMMAAVDKLGQLFDLPIEKQDGMLSLPNSKPAECTIRRLVYHLPTGPTQLNNLNLEIDSGERIALVGPSGSGKSILMDLMYGLRAPDHGYVEIDGIDPRELRPDILRRSVAMIREIELFEGTIAENVHLERPDVSSAQVRNALEQVEVLNELLTLPLGLETPINATGHPLSPIQQRKLMLARAIVGQPSLLLVDGLLDGLPDADSLKIMERLCDAGQPWTLLFVTGRSILRQQATREIELRPTAANNQQTEETPHA